ncbi:MAG: TRAP transporter TatT component family protein [Gammaproteobacteria bacterium]|nr:TRAP transporter TatT component family protein [Gammaproteobacteria bacterium]
MRSHLLKTPRVSILLLGVALMTSCSAIISGVTNSIAEDLSAAVLGSPDFGVVDEGLPAYLLLVDALVEGNPADAALLNTAAMLNGSYASGFVDDQSRREYFATKAKSLALRASCHHRASFCDFVATSFSQFKEAVDDTSIRDIDYLYILASSWSGWIQVHSSDYAAIAELPKAKYLMERVIQLDSNYAKGSPYIYMGVFATFLPAALGGEPEVGRENFELAVEISGGENLYAKSMMAEMYARAIFDRELHDRLVEEVLESDPRAGDLTLQNVVAQKLALQLRESADDFF